jgi:hypothetical protein
MPSHLPSNSWSDGELSKYIPLEDLRLATHGRLKNVPGYDYQQIDMLDLDRFPIVKELELESEIDVTLKFLNGPVHLVDGVVKIVRRQQHSPACRC